MLPLNLWHNRGLIRALSSATEVFGPREEALRWLQRPNPRLRNQAPLDLRKTDAGSRMVEELFTQIDEGMFV